MIEHAIVLGHGVERRRLVQADASSGWPRPPGGVTSLVISHDMAEAAKLADRVYVLDKGKLVSQGSFAELRMQPDCLAAKFVEASRVG